jgi:hypothetical protein
MTRLQDGSLPSPSGESSTTSRSSVPKVSIGKTKQLVAFAEDHARQLRQIAGVGPEDALDPVALAGRFRLLIVTPDQIKGLSDQNMDALDTLSAKEFSGGAQVLPDGTLLIIANPRQTPERLRVTVMEEVAHRHLGHKPSSFMVEPGGQSRRTYDPVTEDEAYWTASATLLPRVCVGRAIWKRRPAKAIAKDFGVSVELVEFRIKILNLWTEYRRFCPQSSEDDDK